MATSPRLWGFLASCAAALGALALGSELQQERVQAPAPDVPLAAASLASGNIILLTGALVATGATAAAWVLLRTRETPWLRSLGGAGALWMGVYIAVFLLQSAFANYFVCNQGPPVPCRQAVLRIML